MGVSTDLDLGYFDHIIVGGGAAGIATSEALTRNGSKVALVEKHSKLAVEASGEQHGWGQFGALYLNALDKKVSLTCLENVKILADMYKGFEGHNLATDEAGQLISKDPKNPSSWYRSDRIFYYYPDASEVPGMTPEHAKGWNETVARVLSRTKEIVNHDWRSETATLDAEPTSSDTVFKVRNAVRKWKQFTKAKQPSGAIARRSLKDRVISKPLENYTIVESHDRPMRSKKILESIHKEFLRQGGTDFLSSEVTSYKELDDGLIEVTFQNGQFLRAKDVVFTAGGGLEKLGASISTVLSPLLVVTPAVCERNLVHLTPDRKYTINHIHHVDQTTGKSYSLIGNGDGIHPEDKEGIEGSRENILKLATEMFPNLKEVPDKDKNVYFGYKNEVVKKPGERNYHFEVQEIIPKKVFAAVPGKFTLAPSLAMHLYQRLNQGERMPEPGLGNPTQNDEARLETKVNSRPDSAYSSADSANGSPKPLSSHEDEGLVLPIFLSKERKKLGIATQLHRQIVSNSIQNGSFRVQRNYINPELI